MMLLNPKTQKYEYLDENSRKIMLKTIEFFENRGKKKLKEDDRERKWNYDFVEFIKKEKIFSTLMTPAGYGPEGSRWDTFRICDFNEILGFYGLCYWYTWQVSMLGLGPIWMSNNEEIKQKTAQLLQDGAVFAFGLSEKEHGADLYASEMMLTPMGDGTYMADGGKYYIGNANEAALVSTFGKDSDTDDFVFFVVNSEHENFECIQNVVNSQNYVAEYALHAYPITEADILSKGRDAWDASLNTINLCKFNLGWVSIGICTHAFYEAITHAAHRRLFNHYVTDFPHIKQLLTDAYTIIKFMANYFFSPDEFPEIPKRDDTKNDGFLFNQGPTKGLGKIRFHDYNIAYDSMDLPNIDVFKEQIAVFKEFLLTATPNEEQAKDIDFLLNLGELFTLVAYGQLIIENYSIYSIDEDIVNQIFDFMVRDFSKFALQVYSKTMSTDRQMELCLKMIKKPVADVECFERVWSNYVCELIDTYEMND
jgi:alkylation response protein AidB-like acyl-CoA dehydrogenase